MPHATSDLTLENILLGLIGDQPQHGYALFQRIQGSQDLSRIWHVKRSKLYYLLEQLEDKGYLSSRMERTPSYPDRKIYHLTEAGKSEFRDWVNSPVESGRHMRIAFLSRLYFALQSGKGEALDLIGKQEARCQTWKESLQDELGSLSSPDFLARQVYQFRIGQVEAMLRWLESCKAEIQSD